MQRILSQKLIRQGPGMKQIRQNGMQLLRDRPDLAEVARVILMARRARSLYFGLQLFMEPSWDILLDLRAHHGSQRTVASLFVSDYAPTTTGLRHLRELHKAGLVDRWTDPDDGRRRLAGLSERGLKLMDQFLASLIR